MEAKSVYTSEDGTLVELYMPSDAECELEDTRTLMDEIRQILSNELLRQINGRKV